MAMGDSGRPPHPSSHLVNDGFSTFLEALDEAQQPEHIRARKTMLNVPLTCDSCGRHWDIADAVEVLRDNTPLEEEIWLCVSCAHRLGERLRAV